MKFNSLQPEPEKPEKPKRKSSELFSVKVSDFVSKFIILFYKLYTGCPNKQENLVTNFTSYLLRNRVAIPNCNGLREYILCKMFKRLM